MNTQKRRTELALIEKEEFLEIPKIKPAVCTCKYFIKKHKTPTGHDYKCPVYREYQHD